MSELAVKPRERFVFIDAMRGIFALLVMFHHLLSMHEPILTAVRTAVGGPHVVRSAWQKFIYYTFETDIQRVQVFFVISGFVIAWSLRKLTINFKSAFNFILRRQIRLDPAYWTCVFLSVFCMILQAAFVDHSKWAEVAGPRRILLNLFYLQYLTRNAKIPMLYVTWTLCLEVQLYLVFIVHLFVIQWLARLLALPKRWSWTVYIGVMTPMWLASLYYHWESWVWPYFLLSWYLFYLGVVLCWVLEKRVPDAALFAICAVELGWSLYRHQQGEPVDSHVYFSAGIAAVIYAAIQFNGLSTWLGNRYIQFLGRISYSIFLVQWDIGRMVEGWGLHFTHNNKWAAIFWLLAAGGASIFAAWLLYICVEKPSIRLAARLKPRPAEKPEFVGSKPAVISEVAPLPEAAT